MLSEKNIAVLGGDDRYVKVIEDLAKKGAQVVAIGFDEIEFSLANVLKSTLHDVDFGRVDGIVLPIGGTDASGHIEVEYSEDELVLTEDMIKQTKRDCVIYTGTANPFLRDLAAACERKLIVLFERDDVAIANSIPTAEAALQIAMEQTKYTVHGANVLVVGLGRIGMTIARLFKNVGAHVYVAARNQADFARIREMNMQPVRVENLDDSVSEVDVCVNTVPVAVLTETVLQQMNADGLIIDVASKPGGTDFKAAERLGIQTIHALGLPGKVAPKTAGKILAETIAELVAGRE